VGAAASSPGAPGGRAPGSTSTARVLARLRKPSASAIAWIRRLACILALVPLARLVAGAFTGGLGANPIEFITRSGMICTFGLTPNTPAPLSGEAAMMPATNVPWPVKSNGSLSLS
jgi:hypothetical protein